MQDIQYKGYFLKKHEYKNGFDIWYISGGTLSEVRGVMMEDNLEMTEDDLDLIIDRALKADITKDPRL